MDFVVAAVIMACSRMFMNAVSQIAPIISASCLLIRRPREKADYDLTLSSFITVSALSPTLAIAVSISSLLFPSFLTHNFAIPLFERSIRLRSGLGGRICRVMAA